MKAKIGLGGVGIAIVVLTILNIHYHQAESKIDSELEKIRTEKQEIKSQMNAIIHEQIEFGGSYNS